MKSLCMLPKLYKLPAEQPVKRKSFQELIADLVNNDTPLGTAKLESRADFATEVWRLTNIRPKCADVRDVDEAHNILDKHLTKADRSTKLKLQSLRMLPQAISVVSAIGGRALSIAADAIAPGSGNIVNIPATVALEKSGSLLSKHLEQPRLMLALNVAKLDLEDLYYLKNKRLVDDLAERFLRMAEELAATN